MNYTEGTKPDEAYETWRKEWSPPRTNIRVRNGMVLLEFSPFGNEGRFWLPKEGASYNAKVIIDSTGELRTGAEVALEGNEAEQFRLDGRQVALVKKSDIFMEIL